MRTPDNFYTTSFTDRYMFRFKPKRSFFVWWLYFPIRVKREGGNNCTTMSLFCKPFYHFSCVLSYSCRIWIKIFSKQQYSSFQQLIFLRKYSINRTPRPLPF